MTEQPVETEQQFLGNETADVVQNLVDDIKAGIVPGAAFREHYVPNAHRFRPAPLPEPPAPAATDLQLEAEVHAGHAARELENGELDAGIAWLQSALAFAQNARHSREFSIGPGAL